MLLAGGLCLLSTSCAQTDSAEVSGAARVQTADARSLAAPSHPTDSAALPNGEHPATDATHFTFPGSSRPLPTPTSLDLDQVEDFGSSETENGTSSGVRFYRPGPVSGSSVASVTIVLDADWVTPESSTELVDSIDPYNDHSVIDVNGVQLIHWPSIGGVSGKDIGQNDRNFSLYAFRAPERGLVQVTFDGIPEREATEYAMSVVESFH